MADSILDLTQVQYRIPVTTDNRNLLRREIRNMFGALNDLEVYKAFYDWVGRPDTEAEVMERHGEPPRIYRCKGTADEYTRIAALIGEFRESPHKSLGIICKDEAQALALYERFREEIEDLFFLSYLSTAYVNGIIVTSAHMAKGLEFDEVIVPHAGHKNYQTEIDRSMLYVAVTRAMHKLSLTCTGDLFSPFWN